NLLANFIFHKSGVCFPTHGADYNRTRLSLNNLSPPDTLGGLRQVVEAHYPATFRGQHIIFVSTLDFADYSRLASAPTNGACRCPDCRVTDFVSNERNCIIRESCCNNPTSYSAISKRFGIDTLEYAKLPVLVINTVLTT